MTIRGYTVEASGYADDMARYFGVFAESGNYSDGLTKEAAETQAKACARQLMAGGKGRVVVKLAGVVVKDLSFVNGKWS